MTERYGNARALANAGTANPCGKIRNDHRTTFLAMQKARGLFPRKTSAHLVELTGYSLRTCEGWLAGETKIPSDAIAALLQSEWGLEFVAAIMGAARPRWWDWLLRIAVMAGVRRRREADLRLLQDAANADRDLSAAITQAEAALCFQDEDQHRPRIETLCAVARAPGGAVVAKRRR